MKIFNHNLRTEKSVEEHASFEACIIPISLIHNSSVPRPGRGPVPKRACTFNQLVRALGPLYVRDKYVTSTLQVRKTELQGLKPDISTQ